MKAMILAAGLGSRLFPITSDKPKALVQIAGKTLLELVILKLKNSGCKEIIINVHHFADMIIDYVKKKNFEVDIQFSDEKNELLDTGGGLKNAASFFDKKEPFVLHNVDILCDINLNDLLNAHLKSKALATISVRNRNTNRYFLFNDDNILCGWKNIKSDDVKIVRKSKKDLISFSNCGIQIFNPEIFSYMPSENVFSLIDLYLQVAPSQKIKAFVYDDGYWIDLGKKENFAEAEKIIESI